MLPSQVRRQQKSVANLSVLWSPPPESLSTNDIDLSNSRATCCYTFLEFFRLLSKIKSDIQNHGACLIFDMDLVMEQISNPMLFGKLCQCTDALTMLSFFSEALVHIIVTLSSKPPTHPEYSQNNQQLQEFRVTFQTTLENLKGVPLAVKNQRMIASLLERLNPFLNPSPATTSATVFNPYIESIRPL